MGAWGTGSFDNDDALDWVIELIDSDDLSVVSAALDETLAMANDYLEVDTCDQAIAAAEVVVALRGRAAALPDDVAAWVVAHADLDTTAVLPKVNQALQFILADSELKELWEDSDDYEQWVAGLNDLLQRSG